MHPAIEALTQLDFELSEVRPLRLQRTLRAQLNVALYAVERALGGAQDDVAQDRYELEKEAQRQQDEEREIRRKERELLEEEKELHERREDLREQQEALAVEQALADTLRQQARERRRQAALRGVLKRKGGRPRKEGPRTASGRLSRKKTDGP